MELIYFALTNGMNFMSVDVPLGYKKRIRRKENKKLLDAAYAWKSVTSYKVHVFIVSLVLCLL